MADEKFHLESEVTVDEKDNADVHDDEMSAANLKAPEEVDEKDEGREEATQDAEEDKQDSYHDYLVSEYRRFRAIALVFAIIGFSGILAAVSLSMSGILVGKFYNLAMSIANAFIVFMAVVIFTRTRPFKKRIKQYENQANDPSSQQSIREEESEEAGETEESRLAHMDDIYKILERKIRTELIPESDEYRKLRRTWLAIYAVAAVIAVASLCLFYFMPELNVISTIALLAAFVLVVIAFYIDRTRMRPMRVEWARKFGMTEMQYRDNMR